MLIFRIAFKGPRYITKRLYNKFTLPVKQVNNRVIQEYVNWAQSAMNNGEYKEAVKRWVKVIKKLKNPPTAGSYLKLSECYKNLGLLNKSEALLTLVLAKYPRDIRAYEMLFDLFILQEDYKKSADTWWDISRNFNPKVKLNLWTRFSNIYRQNGRFKDAENLLLNGLADYPGCEAFKAEYAEISMQQGNYTEALSRWKKLLGQLDENHHANQSTKVIMARLYNSTLPRLININRTNKQIDRYDTLRLQEPDKKIAVYTAIAGDYDNLKLPEMLNPDYDYIIFTDQDIPSTGIFIVRPLPFVHHDKTRSARYVKTHPHTLLKGYDLAIWVDANILITGDISKYVSGFVNSKKAVGAIPHPVRHTVYQEAIACIEAKKDEINLIDNQISQYHTANFHGTGLVESNFMIFDLLNSNLGTFFDIWWREIDKYSRRDQLSFNFALEAANLGYYPLMSRPICTRNHPDFVVIPHVITDEITPKLIELIHKKIEKNKNTIKLVSRTRNKELPKNPSIDIVVCVYNAMNDVKECLESIESARTNKKVRLIIIDDGSQKETADYLDSFVVDKKWATLSRNKQASGYTKAANKGLSLSTADLVILTNSDTIVTKRWTEKMATAVYSMPKLGLVGPMSSAASHQSIPDHKSKNNQTAINKLPNSLTEEDMNKYCEEWSIGTPRPLVPLVHGFCLGITRELINAIGLFDENNFPKGYGEENDYCFRAMNAGFGAIIATDTYIFHEKSKSYTDSGKRIALMKSGSDKLRELHGDERVQRAIKTMQNNPVLVAMREKAAELYLKYEK